MDPKLPGSDQGAWVGVIDQLAGDGWGVRPSRLRCPNTICAGASPSRRPWWLRRSRPRLLGEHVEDEGDVGELLLTAPGVRYILYMFIMSNTTAEAILWWNGRSSRR